MTSSAEPAILRRLCGSPDLDGLQYDIGVRSEGKKPYRNGSVRFFAFLFFTAGIPVHLIL
jgi:hypothetical protein